MSPQIVFCACQSTASASCRFSAACLASRTQHDDAEARKPGQLSPWTGAYGGGVVTTGPNFLLYTRGVAQYWNDALRWSRAVRAFVKQPDVYFDDGIFFRHWCTPPEYNTPKFDCAR